MIPPGPAGPGGPRHTPRVPAGVGISRQLHVQAAVEEAARAALEPIDTADTALLFAAPGAADELPGMLDAAVACLGTDRIVGATAHGVLGSGQEIEQESGLAILALAGVESLPFLLADPSGQEREACREIAAGLDGGPRPEDLVVLLPDPRSFDPDAFLPALREHLAPARVVGAGSGDPLSGQPLQWCGRSLESGGVAGLVIRGRRPARIGVTQACRPVTRPLTVTRAQGHWLLELDGRPALEVFREAAQGALARDLRRAAAFVLVALPADPDDASLAAGSYRVRQVVGFEEKANAFAMAESAKPGDRLALVLREPESARADLKDMLARVEPPERGFGLYFDCCARGAGFFGVAGLEAAYLESRLGALPLAGMFGSCEIGPIGGRTELLTYTGVLALVDG